MYRYYLCLIFAIDHVGDLQDIGEMTLWTGVAVLFPKRSWPREAVCLGHGASMSFKSSTSGPSFVSKWTKSFQPISIIPICSAAPPILPTDTVHFTIFHIVLWARPNIQSGPKK